MLSRGGVRRDGVLLCKRHMLVVKERLVASVLAVLRGTSGGPDGVRWSDKTRVHVRGRARARHLKLRLETTGCVRLRGVHTVVADSMRSHVRVHRRPHRRCLVLEALKKVAITAVKRVVNLGHILLNLTPSILLDHMCLEAVRLVHLGLVRGWPAVLTME